MRGESMKKKEYPFQCIIGYETETELEARLGLQYDLKHNGNRLFECIQENTKNLTGGSNG